MSYDPKGEVTHALAHTETQQGPCGLPIGQASASKLRGGRSRAAEPTIDVTDLHGKHFGFPESLSTVAPVEALPSFPEVAKPRGMTL